MKHKLKLRVEEKVRRWLELCDFTYNLMKKNLSSKEFKKRLERIREEHLERDYRLLKSLAKNDQRCFN
jgi:hypothetical protein